MVQSPPGMHDVLPERTGTWRRIEGLAARLGATYGYHEIRTPLLEFTSLFVRTVGETTDIVEKEMYTFGEGDDSLTLRPELTAPIVRSVLQHDLHRKSGIVKVYYVGPLFRRERPQKGRLRQFHQFGIEALGVTSPRLDAETILLGVDFLRQAGTGEVRLRLNSTGCPTCRPLYRETILSALRPHAEELCGNCRRRMDRNVFRVFDCKAPECRRRLAGLPPILDHVCESCAGHHVAVVEELNAAGVRPEEDRALVRGLDYYCRTVYEFASPRLGAQDALGGGGRYDGLAEQLGGPHLPAVGFAIGLERVLLAAGTDRNDTPPSQPVAWVVAVRPENAPHAFRLATRLRHDGIPAEVDHEDRSLKAQMRSANKSGAGSVLLQGPDEVRTEKIRCKDMQDGREELLDYETLRDRLCRMPTREMPLPTERSRP